MCGADGVEWVVWVKWEGAEAWRLGGVSGNGRGQRFWCAGEWEHVSRIDPTMDVMSRDERGKKRDAGR